MQKLINFKCFYEKIFEGFLKMVGSMKLLSVLFLVGLHFYGNFAFGASESKISDDETPAAITSSTALEPKLLYSSDEDFTRSITDILGSAQYKQNLTGGSGGVHLFEGSDQKFLVKCSKDFPHMREEIMADVLYHALSVPVPKFFVVDTLPQTESFKPLNSVCPQGLYRISEFIEQDAALPPDFKSRVSEYFLVDAFLANRDIAGNSSNVMAKSGVLYRIDNGGALRYRSIGGKKGMGGDSPWSSTLIPEVTSLPTGEEKFYDALTPDTFRSQAKRILHQVPRLFQEFKRAADGIEMPFRDQQDLQTMLVERLKVIEMHFAGNETFYTSKKMPVTPSMAGGAFIIKKGNAVTTDGAAGSGDNQYYVLLGQRRSGRDESNNKWVTLGGSADFGKDFDIAHAIARELFEESNGLINIPDTTLSAQTSHDLVRWNQRFRQYFVLRKDTDRDIPEAELNARLHSAITASSREYHQFKWVPLAALIDPKTLENGFFDWNSERFDLFEPFRDLLQTAMVQKNLRDLKAKHKLPKDQHTQSILQGFVDGDLSTLKIQRFLFEKTLPLHQRLHEQELADQVFKKAGVHEELVKSSRKDPRQELSLSRYGFNNGLSPRNPYPFTASEGFLKLFLGSDYTHFARKDALSFLRRDSSFKGSSNLDDVYMANLQAFFNKKPAGFEEMPYDSFLNTLVQVLKKERTMDPNYQVFYHGTQGDIGYLYDIFTEFRQLLKGEFADNIVVMRSLDEAFKDINNVQDFIEKFKGKNNYAGNYQDMGLSVNVYLFGSPLDSGSSTLRYFHEGHSAQAISAQKFFDFLNTTLLGLNLQTGRYWRLFESIMGSKPFEDGRLYQIFIRQDYVDSLVYAAESGGAPLSISYDDIQSALAGYDLSTSVLIDCASGGRAQITKAPTMMSSLLDVLKKRPDLFEKGLKGSSKDIQARLFMKPQCMQRSDVSQTFIYHKNPSIDQDKVNALKMQLRNYLREDLSRWFGEKYKPDSDVFHKKSLSTMDHFKRQYQTAFDQDLVFEEDNFNQKLARIYETEDMRAFTKLLKGNNLEELLNMEIITADSYRKKDGGPKKFIEKLSFLVKLLASSEGELQRKYIWYVSTKFDWNKHILNWSNESFDIAKDIALFQQLEQWGIFNRNQIFDDGKTWAHIAIDRYYYIEPLAPFIDANLENSSGIIPLEYAFSKLNGNRDTLEKVIMILLSKGVHVNKPFSNGQTLLAMAVALKMKQEIVESIINLGADVNSLLQMNYSVSNPHGVFIKIGQFPVIIDILNDKNVEKKKHLAHLMVEKRANLYNGGIFEYLLYGRHNLPKEDISNLIKHFFGLQGNVYDLLRFKIPRDKVVFQEWLEANSGHGLTDIRLLPTDADDEKEEE